MTEKDDCPQCRSYKLSAAMWRNKAYELAGTPLPWEPEELLRKEYERGYLDGRMQKRKWQGLTNKERSALWWNTNMSGMPEHDYGKAIEAKLKEKNT